MPFNVRDMYLRPIKSTIKKKLSAITYLSIVSISLLVILSVGGITMLSVMRSYVVGEGNWSRGRRDGALSLERFIETSDKKYYDLFFENIKSPDSYNKALLEIDRDLTDFEIVDMYLIAGGNDPKEVRIMGRFLKLCKGISYISMAVDNWHEGLRYLDEMTALAGEIKIEITQKGGLRNQDRALLRTKLDNLNERLKRAEFGFLNNISLASSLTVGLLIRLILLFGAGLLIFVWFASVATYRQLLQGLGSISNYAKLITMGDFRHNISYAEEDELGDLSRTISIMGRQLKAIIDDLAGKNIILIEHERKTQDLIRETEALFKAISSSAIVCKLNFEGKITFVNKAFLEISGFSEGELLGSKYRIVSSDRHDEKFYENIRDIVEAGETWKGEVCCKNKMGTHFWCFVTIIPFFKEEIVTGYLSIQFDITHEKETETQLHHASRLTSLGEMAGNIAHEINTPLAAIQLIMDRTIRLAMTNQLEKIDWSFYSDSMTSAINRVTKVIAAMRRFGGKEGPVPLTTYQLSSVINDAIELCREKFHSKGIVLRVFDSESIQVKCRPVELSQVLINLLSNSYKAILKFEEKWIEIKSEITDEFARIIITDSGNGIDEKLAGKIMHPFVSTGVVGESMGIGLSISHQIVKEHGGRLYYDGNFVNTRFIIELPYSKC
jgi:PAS domain S-box-containing protein